MYKNDNVNDLKKLLRKLIVNEDNHSDFDRILKAIDKELISSAFKLKRTLMDRELTNSVLNNTIGELKDKTNAIEKQRKLLEEQSKFKETLFANVSHELRTPLHGIQGMNQLLAKTNLDETQQEYVDIVRSSADNLLVIINDLLTFSQMNAGKVFLKNQPFSLPKLCNELENILSLKAQAKGLSLICMCPPQLPEFLIGDRIRLYQLFINLLNNAVKFTHKGYILMNIYPIGLSSDKVDLQFEIRDSGIGMKPDRLEKIFASFTRVHEEDGIVYEGAGLGLNIVKKLVNIMGGTIEVKSELGKGTSFFVNMSFDVAREAEIVDHESKQVRLPIPSHWKYKNLLMIEDNKANILYAKNMFLDWGIELKVAETLEEAKEKLVKEKFDCILSDVKLPDGNGLEFIRALRGNSNHQNQHTPVMVLTASSNEKEAVYAKDIDVQSYIGKPFKQELIVQELSKLLDEPKTKKMINSILESTPENKEAYFVNLDRNFKHKNHLKVEILNIFLDQIPRTLEMMEKALLSNDMETFHLQGHSIKSTICNVGLPKLQPIINKIDEYCYRKINLEQLPELFEAFKQAALEDVQIILREKEKLMVA